MQFKIDGLTFSKDDLTTVTLESLEVNSISGAHLYFKLPNGQLMVLLRAGDLLTKEFINEYKEKGIESFYAYEVSNTEIVEEFTLLFKKLLNSKNEIERQQVGEQIIHAFADHFWLSSDESYLCFIQACYKTFFLLDIENIETLHAKSVVLYSRAIVASSFCVINCLMNRIVDSYFIKDLYSAVMLMDYGLIHNSGISFSVLKACEYERNNPGAGVLYLDQKALSDNEKETFIQHPKMSAAFLEGQKHLFFNKEIVDIILYHHEKSDGTGFPFNIPYSSMTDMETFITFSDNIVAFKEYRFFKGDNKEIIQGAIEELKANHQDLPIDGVLKQFQEAINWATQKVITEEAS